MISLLGKVRWIKKYFVGFLGNDEKVAATVLSREEFGGAENFLTGLAITNTPGSSSGYFTPYLANAGKPEESSLYIHIGGNRQCSIETRQDKSSSVLGAEVCGWKPHHLKPTASPVTLCTKPTSLSFYLVLCKSACNVSCFQEKRSALPFNRKNICKALAAMALGMTARAQLRKCIC